MSFKRVKAHAKINLTLCIAARRSDGYHDIETVMVPIGLCDTVTVRADDGISLSCSNRYVPCDDRNIAYKAAKLFFNETGIGGGAQIDIEKKIPVCGGLGGGSSDAAAVLNALNDIYGAKLSADDRRRLAAKLGADVPFFIESKSAFCTGRGDIIEPITDNSAFYYSVNVWGRGASTEQMYAEADKNKQAYRSSDGVIEALKNNDIELLAGSIFNDFEPVCNLLRPNTLKLKNAYLRAGAIASCLSGSGAAVYGVFDKKENAAKAARFLKKTQFSD